MGVPMGVPGCVYLPVTRRLQDTVHVARVDWVSHCVGVGVPTGVSMCGCAKGRSWVYQCVCVPMGVPGCVCVRVCLWAFLGVSVWVYLWEFLGVSMCGCTYGCICVWVYLWVCVLTCRTC